MSTSASTCPQPWQVVAPVASVAWRCRPQRSSLRALQHRGEPRALLSWVLAMSADRRAVGRVLDDRGVSVDETVAGSRRLSVIRVGEVVVEQPGSRFGWDVCTAESFGHSYARAPRELPIYDDGEVA